MNVRFRTWILALLPFCLSACGDSASPGSDAPSGLAAIGFSPTVEAQTRAADFTKENLTSMGVFAYSTQGSNFSSSSTPNFMCNQKVEKAAGSGGSWTYTPVKYWPGNSNDKLSFFAYAPHGTAGLIPSGNTASNYPFLTYIVPTAEAEQTDLLAAQPLLNQTYAMHSGNVDFKMKHALAKITFKVKNEAGAAVSVSGFSLDGTASGTLTYNGDASGFSWGSYGGTTTFTGKAGSSAPVSVPTTTTSVPATDVATFYMLPNTGSTFSITYSVGGGAPKTVTGKTIPDIPAWTAGAAINYTMTIKTDNISEVVAEMSTAWLSDGESAVESVIDVKVGDFYYSDGTFSDGGYQGREDGDLNLADVKLTPEQKAKAIGVVFYVGDIKGDNYGLLDAKFPKGTHGLVVSMWNAEDPDHSGNKTMTWTYGGAESVKNQLAVAGFTVPAGYDFQAMSKKQGYINTLALRQYNAYLESTNPTDAKRVKPILALDKFETAHPAPAQSSGWYWPSNSENAAMLYGNAAMDTHFAEVGGDAYGHDFFWSSTESSYNANEAFTAIVDYGTASGENKASVSHAARPILAF